MNPNIVSWKDEIRNYYKSVNDFNNRISAICSYQYSDNRFPLVQKLFYGYGPFIGPKLLESLEGVQTINELLTSNFNFFWINLLPFDYHYEIMNKILTKVYHVSDLELLLNYLTNGNMNASSFFFNNNCENDEQYLKIILAFFDYFTTKFGSNAYSTTDDEYSGIRKRIFAKLHQQLAPNQPYPGTITQDYELLFHLYIDLFMEPEPGCVNVLEKIEDTIVAQGEDKNKVKIYFIHCVKQKMEYLISNKEQLLQLILRVFTKFNFPKGRIEFLFGTKEPSTFILFLNELMKSVYADCSDINLFLEIIACDNINLSSTETFKKLKEIKTIFEQYSNKIFNNYPNAKYKNVCNELRPISDCPIKLNVLSIGDTNTRNALKESMSNLILLVNQLERTEEAFKSFKLNYLENELVQNETNELTNNLNRLTKLKEECCVQDYRRSLKLMEIQTNKTEMYNKQKNNSIFLEILKENPQWENRFTSPERKNRSIYDYTISILDDAYKSLENIKKTLQDPSTMTENQIKYFQGSFKNEHELDKDRFISDLKLLSNVDEDTFKTKYNINAKILEVFLTKDFFYDLFTNFLELLDIFYKEKERTTNIKSKFIRFQRALRELDFTKKSTLENVITQIIQEKEQESIWILLDSNREIGKIITLLLSSRKILSFLSDKKGEDMTQLYEYMELNQEIRVEDIDELRKLIDRFIMIKKNEPSKFFQNLYETRNGISLKEILQKLPFLNGLADQFEMLWKKKQQTDPEKSNIMKRFLSKSEIFFTLKTKDDIIIDDDYYTFSNNIINSEEDFKELWERSKLEVKAEDKLSKDKVNKENLERYQTFTKIILEVFKIKETINKAYMKGVFSHSKVKIVIQSKFILDIILDNEIQKKPNEFLEELNEHIKEFDHNIKKVQQLSQNIYISFLYGRQITSVYEYIIKNTPALKEQFKHIIRYILNGKYFIKGKTTSEETINNIVNKIKEKNFSSEETLNNIEQYLSHIIDSRFTNSTHPPLQHTLKSGLYYFLSDDMIESTITKVYIQLTNQNPSAGTCIICDRNTSSEELIAFLSRVVKITITSPFFIGNFYQTRSIVQTQVIKYLQSKADEQFLGKLIFILHESELHTFKQTFEHFGLFKGELDQTKLNEYSPLTNIENGINVKIVMSPHAGLGKSTWIKKQQYKNIYTFTFGDATPTQSLVNNISNVFKNYTKDNSALHFAIYDSDTVDKVTSFLFNAVVTRCLRFNDKLFFFPSNIQTAFIEVPSFTFYNKCSFLHLFNKSEFTTPLYQPISVPNKDFNFVCSFLQDKATGDITKSVLESYAKLENPLEGLKSLIDTNISFYQLNSFIKHAYDQLHKFNGLATLNPSKHRSFKLAEKKQLHDLREVIIENLFQFLKKICLPTSSQVHADKAKDNQINNIIETNTISYEFLDLPLVIMNKSGKSITVFTERGSTNSAKADKLMQIYSYNIANDESIENIDIKREYKGNESFIKFARKYLNNDNLNEKQLEEGYVFTTDNFFKMIVIDMKLEANVPVLLEGETGCGKTYLIKNLAKILGKKLVILNIHAGITEQNVIDWMNENVLNKQENEFEHLWVFFDEINTSNAIGLIEEIMCHKTMRGIQINNEIRFIGACNPYRAKTKKEGLCFGLKTKRNIGSSNNNNNRNAQSEEVVYNVLPITNAFTNFIFNFGSLSRNEERKYISSMIKLINIGDNNVEKLTIDLVSESQHFMKVNYEVSSVSLRDAKRFGIFYKWFNKSVEDQNKLENIVNTNEIEAKLTYVFLSLYICYILKLPEDKEISQQQGTTRKEALYDLMEKETQKYQQFKYLTKKHIIKIIDNEVNRITSRMTIPKGIALNGPLKENIFALFSCLMTKVPLYIIGKPGSSKTLSVTLLDKSMRGKDSHDAYFKELPALKLVNYQGSISTTSQDIEKVFEKAKNEQASNSSIIPLIFFDELGLAELSENNPLKVLHFLLEPDESNKSSSSNKVSFVGISNWILDASKQNRGIFISRPDPGVEDLMKIANEISKGFGVISQTLIKHLCEQYYEYKKQFTTNVFAYYCDFHGLRDFYALIKEICTQVENKKEHYPNGFTQKDIHDFSINGLERNFRGIPLKEEKIHSFPALFGEAIDERNRGNTNYFITKLIESNVTQPITITDRQKHSRYLMLISNPVMSFYFLQNILLKHNVKPKILIGSKFKNDLLNKDYTFTILQKILYHVEKGQFLILQDLESVYPALFDLLNQNFLYLANGKRYTKVAVGNVNRPTVSVHENFWCAVLTEEKESLLDNPPLLNRFEKHNLSFDVLFDSLGNQRNEVFGKVGILEKFFKNTCNIIKNDYNFSLNIENQLMNLGGDEIKGIIYGKIDKKFVDNDNNEEIQLHILDKQIIDDIKNTFSQDYFAFLSLAGKYHNNIIGGLCQYTLETSKYYSNIYSCIYEQLTEKLKRINSSTSSSSINVDKLPKIKIHSQKYIVYTFSSIEEDISFDKELLPIEHRPNADQFHFISMKFIKMQGFDSQLIIERDLDENNLQLKKILRKEIERQNKDNPNYYQYAFVNIKFRVEDTQHLHLMEQIIENTHRDLVMQIKGPTFRGYNLTIVYVFTIHIKRVFEKKGIEKSGQITLHSIHPAHFISRLNKSCIQVFIDNLNGKKIYIEGKELTWFDLISNRNDAKKKKKLSILFKIKETFEKTLQQTYDKIVILHEGKGKTFGKDRLAQVKMFIEPILQDEVINFVDQSNFLLDFVINDIMTEVDIDMFSKFILYIKTSYSRYLLKLLIRLEKLGVIEFILNNQDNANHYLEQIMPYVKSYIKNVVIEKEGNLNEITINTNNKIILSDFFFNSIYPTLQSCVNKMNKKGSDEENEVKEILKKIKDNFYNLPHFVFIKNADDDELSSDLIVSLLNENKIDLSFRDLFLQASSLFIEKDETNKHFKTYLQLAQFESHKSFLSEYIQAMKEVQTSFNIKMEDLQNKVKEIILNLPETDTAKYINEREQKTKWLLLLNDALIYNVFTADIKTFVQDYKIEYEQYKRLLNKLYGNYCKKWQDKFQIKSVLIKHIELCCSLIKLIDKHETTKQFDKLQTYIETFAPKPGDPYLKLCDLNVIETIFTDIPKSDINEFILQLLDLKIHICSNEEQKDLIKNILTNKNLLKYSINFFDDYFKLQQVSFYFKDNQNDDNNLFSEGSDKPEFLVKLSEKLESYGNTNTNEAEENDSTNNNDENRLLFDFIFMQIVTRYIKIEFGKYFESIKNVNTFLSEEENNNDDDENNENERNITLQVFRKALHIIAQVPNDLPETLMLLIFIAFIKYALYHITEFIIGYEEEASTLINAFDSLLNLENNNVQDSDNYNYIYVYILRLLKYRSNESTKKIISKDFYNRDYLRQYIDFIGENSEETFLGRSNIMFYINNKETQEHFVKMIEVLRTLSQENYELTDAILQNAYDITFSEIEESDFTFIYTKMFFELYFAKLFSKDDDKNDLIELLSKLVSIKQEENSNHLITSNETILNNLAKFYDPENEEMKEYLNNDFPEKDIELILIGIQFYIYLDKKKLLEPLSNLETQSEDTPLYVFKKFLQTLMNHIKLYLENPSNQEQLDNYIKEESKLLASLFQTNISQWTSLYIFLNDVLYEMQSKSIDEAFEASYKKNGSEVSNEYILLFKNFLDEHGEEDEIKVKYSHLKFLLNDMFNVPKNIKDFVNVKYFNLEIYNDEIIYDKLKHHPFFKKYFEKSEEINKIEDFVSKVNPLIQEFYNHLSNGEHSRKDISNKKLSDEMLDETWVDTFCNYLGWDKEELQNRSQYTLVLKEQFKLSNENNEQEEELNRNQLIEKYNTFIAQYGDILNDMCKELRTYGYNNVLNNEVYFQDLQKEDVIVSLSSIENNFLHIQEGDMDEDELNKCIMTNINNKNKILPLISRNISRTLNINFHKKLPNEENNEENNDEENNNENVTLQLYIDSNLYQDQHFNIELFLHDFIHTFIVGKSKIKNSLKTFEYRRSGEDVYSFIHSKIPINNNKTLSQNDINKIKQIASTPEISASLIKLLIKLINHLKGLKQSDIVDGNVKKSIIVSFIENENDETLLTLFKEIGIEDTKEKQFSLRKLLQLFDHIESNQIIRNNLDNAIKETEDVIRLLRGLKDEKEEYITLIFNATRRFLFRYLNEEILPSEFLFKDNIADHMFEIPVLWDRELNTEREDTKFYTDVKEMKIQISQIKTFYELIKEHLNH